MGNCQAVDAATLIIQHPNGKSDKLYSPVNASEIMKTNPGHYVALLLSTTFYPNPTNIINPNKTTTPSSASTTAAANNSSLRITRIKLLRPTDALLLGHAYRLITTQENQQSSGGLKRSQLQKDYQAHVKGTEEEHHHQQQQQEVTLADQEHGNLHLTVSQRVVAANYLINQSCFLIKLNYLKNRTDQLTCKL